MEQQTAQIIPINIKRGFNPIFSCSCGNESFNEGNGTEIIIICKKCGNTYVEVK